jgi:hypothetical protein
LIRLAPKRDLAVLNASRPKEKTFFQPQET